MWTSGHSRVGLVVQRRWCANTAWWRQAASPQDSSAIKSRSSKSLTKDSLPINPIMIALPLSRKPLFPGQQAVLTITHPKVQEAIISRINTQPYLALFHRKAEPGPKQSPEVVLDPENDIYHTGTLAQIVRSTPVTTGQIPSEFSIFIHAHRRLDFVKALKLGPPMEVEVSHWLPTKENKVSPNDPVVRATMNEVLEKIREITRISPMFKESLQMIIPQLQKYSGGISEAEPGKLADFAVSLVSSGESSSLMSVLTEANPLTRLEMVLDLLHKELQVAQMQVKIQERIEDRMGQQQKEFFLRQQLKSIKQELGLEKDDKEAILQKYKERLEDKVIPKEAKEAIDTEMDKLQSLEKNSSEFNISRNYLDWLTILPWSNSSKENFDLKNATEILDREHYGLQDVKERIIEFIAVSKLKNSVQGKIICLVGPPGVGKTSVGKSIAQALNREFYRFSVGGLHDVAEIKGHRRTYIGAMPGKLIQALKKTQTNNPLIMIDEIDKLGRGHQGDPASALLELLDPSQNSSFVDHYLDVPVNMAQVLFIVTANVLDTIPGPLMDRMEVIRVSGYDLPEKMKIARDFLIPKTFNNAGLMTFEDKLEDSAVDSLIRWHCREAGVRNLEKHIEKVCRKIAVKVVELSAAMEPDEIASTTAETTISTPDEPTPETPTPETPALKKTMRDEMSDVVKLGELDDAQPTAENEAPSSVELEELQEPMDEMEKLQRMIEADDAKTATAEGQPGPLLHSHETMKIVGETDALTDEKARMQEAIAFDEETADDWKNNVALRVNKDDVESVTEDNLSKYVGKPVFTSDRLYDKELPGVVMGLAWTAMGGTALYIETMALRGKPRMEITGQLGSVMLESSKIALAVTKSQLDDTSFFDTHEIHLHVPEGATPKDGPSAGVTMVTAMLSLATDTCTIPDLAMTGEVTLRGKVLPVGGIKEKTIAARRSHVKTIIFPVGNVRDVDELPVYLKEGLDIHFATEYADVQKVAFAEEPKSRSFQIPAASPVGSS
eukprot:GEMP01002614.1.p1 GENE.GEMP01002614.1~~GEMP01002614.1.p1  ORF type:complete len:1009 (+),score=242.14 GEMP01002614.1:18-3044(+)